MKAKTNLELFYNEIEYTIKHSDKTASISPCVYSLFKMARSQGKIQDDNFWMARYIEENEGVMVNKIRKPSIHFLRSFWKGVV